MRISDWSSDVCSSDLAQEEVEADTKVDDLAVGFNVNYLLDALSALRDENVVIALRDANSSALVREASNERCRHRSEEHTSELQSLMRISYAVFCLKKKITPTQIHNTEKLRNKHSL